MTEMETAIVASGLRPARTFKETVWQVVKDEGPVLSSGVATKLPSFNAARVKQVIYMMSNEGLVTGDRRAIGTFYTARGDTYADAMAHYRILKTPKPKATAAPIVRSGLLAGLPASLESKSIRELRTLYLALKPLFGD